MGWTGGGGTEGARWGGRGEAGPETRGTLDGVTTDVAGDRGSRGTPFDQGRSSLGRPVSRVSGRPSCARGPTSDGTGRRRGACRTPTTRLRTGDRGVTRGVPRAVIPHGRPPRGGTDVPDPGRGPRGHPYRRCRGGDSPSLVRPRRRHPRRPASRRRRRARTGTNRRRTGRAGDTLLLSLQSLLLGPSSRPGCEGSLGG